MVRTLLTPHTLPSGYSTTPSTLTWTAADIVNGNSFASTGNEMLLVRNDDASTQTFTVTSVAINGRTGNIAAASLGAGVTKYTQKFPTKGWRQSSDKRIWVDASDADVKFAVMKLA